MYDDIKSTINKVDFWWTVHLGAFPRRWILPPAIDPREARVEGSGLPGGMLTGLPQGSRTKWVLEAEDYKVLGL
jgi:hypothetical protein